MACWNTPTTLTWRESADSCNEFSLLSGQDEAAQLCRHGWGGYKATVTTPFGQWEINTEGFWKSRTLITEANTGAPVAECSRGGMSSDRTIRWHNGRTYLWRQAGWWSDSVELIDSGGRRLLTMRTGTGAGSFRDIFKTHGRVEIDQPREDRAHLALLTVISWYFLLIHREEMASVVVIG